MAINEAAEAFLNEAANQSRGSTPIATQTYDNLIHEAGDWTPGQKEQFLGELSIIKVDTLYTDSAWNDKYNDVFYESSEEFGAIVQIINTEMPEVRENRAWSSITDGYIDIGVNRAYVPIVKEQLTGGTTSWAVPYTFTGTQLNAAFKDASGLRRFESNVTMQAENSIKYHLARFSAANRNNFMAEKIMKGNSGGKINVVSLTAEYNAMFGTSLTEAQFLANTNGCLRQVNRILKKYQALLTDMTTMFTMNANSRGQFIPSDRFVFCMLSDFAGLLESELYSTTYHDNFVTLKGYREVPAWQGLRSDSTTLTFNDLSSIDVSRDSSVVNATVDVSESGIVGLMCDKWAIMHTIVRDRTGIQNDNIKDITLIEHQFTDRYVNNLMLNGIVITL